MLASQSKALKTGMIAEIPNKNLSQKMAWIGAYGWVKLARRQKHAPIMMSPTETKPKAKKILYYSARLLTTLAHTKSNKRTASSLFVSGRLGMCDRLNSLRCNLPD